MEVPDQFQRLLFGNVRVQPPGPVPSEQQRLSEMSGVPLGSIGRPAPPPRDPRRLSDVGNGVLTRVLGMPGVENAAVAWFRTPVGLTISLADPGGVPKQMLTGMTFSYQVVSSEYPRLMGLTIHKGRDFAPGEFAEPLVIVDDRTARFLWPGQEPIGQRIKFGRDSSRAPWLEVIGVVRAFNFYRPFSRANQEERLAPRMGAVFVLNGTDTSMVGRTAGIQLAVRVRSADSLMTMPYLVRRTVRNPGEGINLSYLETWMRLTRLDVARERQRFVAVLFTTFAALALAVAALGVYAIVSHSVSQRTREFGVRYALGAGERDIRKSVLFEGNVLALTGIALGLILAARTVGWLQAFLRSEDDRFDSPLFAVVSLLLFGVSLLASYIPARRAARINPVEALRSE
jgi:putative ABC transport system permease protein